MSHIRVMDTSVLLIQWNHALWTPHLCGHPAFVDTLLRALWISFHNPIISVSLNLNVDSGQWFSVPKSNSPLVMWTPKFKLWILVSTPKFKSWILVSTLPRYNIMDSGFQSKSSISPCGHSKLTNPEDRPTCETLVPNMTVTGVHSKTKLVSLLWTPR